MTIDLESGLPELPEGYFWRVSQSFLGIYPWVTLRRKMWIGSEEIDAIWQSHTDFKSTEEEILYLAGVLKERFDERNRRLSTVDALSGDYPPKKLEKL